MINEAIKKEERKIITFANRKGGAGKSWYLCMFSEKLNSLDHPIPTFIQDADTSKVTLKWINSCQSLGRKVSDHSANVNLVDTAGSAGSAFPFLKKSDWIVIVLQLASSDFTVTKEWYESKDLAAFKERVIFAPNRYSNSSDENEYLQKLKDLVVEHGNLSYLLPPVHNRKSKALGYVKFLDGSAINYFISTKRVADDLNHALSQLAKITLGIAI